MDDNDRARALYNLQEIAREHERLEKTWNDIVIAAMELGFIWGAGE